PDRQRPGERVERHPAREARALQVSQAEPDGYAKPEQGQQAKPAHRQRPDRDDDGVDGEDHEAECRTRGASPVERSGTRVTGGVTWSVTWGRKSVTRVTILFPRP